MQRFRPGERPRARWRVEDRARLEDRRRQPRIAPALPVTACGEVSGVLHDISRAGLCVITEDRLEEGQVVSFDLVDDPTGMRCAFRARVVWRWEGLPGRAGLEFVEMSPEQDAWLASRFIDWVASALDL
jgi:hypothetical protein